MIVNRENCGKIYTKIKYDEINGGGIIEIRKLQNQFKAFYVDKDGNTVAWTPFCGSLYQARCKMLDMLEIRKDYENG